MDQLKLIDHHEACENGSERMAVVQNWGPRPLLTIDSYDDDGDDDSDVPELPALP